MPNVATALKEEIVRLARKELRREGEPLRKAIARQRHDVTQLKASVAALTRALGQATKNKRSSTPNDSPTASRQRITAGGLKTLRSRLGLSAGEFGALVGVSGQSVYAWEQERSSPRAAATAAVIALRSIGKKEASSRLAALREAPAAARKRARRGTK